MQGYYDSCPMVSVECGTGHHRPVVSKKVRVFLISTPNYLKVCLKSIICSVAVLEATNSDPYVAVSTVACHFDGLQNVNNQLEISQWPSNDCEVCLNCCSSVNTSA